MKGQKGVIVAESTRGGSSLVESTRRGSSLDMKVHEGCLVSLRRIAIV